MAHLHRSDRRASSRFSSRRCHPGPDRARNWLPLKKQVALVELHAVPMAIAMWNLLAADHNVLIFVDNNSALSLSLCVGEGLLAQDRHLVEPPKVWAARARLRCGIWLDRVESSANIAAGPSLIAFSVMSELNFTEVQAAGYYKVLLTRGRERCARRQRR